MFAKDYPTEYTEPESTMKVLIHKYKVKEILLAGFDGYSHETEENYGEKEMAFFTRNSVLDAMNEGMRRVIGKYSEEVKITFLTKPGYLNIKVK